MPNSKGKEQCHAVTLRSGKKLEKPIRREAESRLAKEEQAGHNQSGSKDRLQQENEETQKILESWYKEDNQEQEDVKRALRKEGTQESPELQTELEKEKSVQGKMAEKL